MDQSRVVCMSSQSQTIRNPVPSLSVSPSVRNSTTSLWPGAMANFRGETTEQGHTLQLRLVRSGRDEDGGEEEEDRSRGTREERAGNSERGRDQRSGEGPKTENQGMGRFKAVVFIK